MQGSVAEWQLWDVVNAAYGGMWNSSHVQWALIKDTHLSNGERVGAYEALVITRSSVQERPSKGNVCVVWEGKQRVCVCGERER